MLILQSCTDSLLHILPGSSSERFPTSSDVTCDVSNTAVEEDIIVIEELSMAINKEAPIGIKQEEILEDISFHDKKTELDEVSCVCICLLSDRHILLVSRNISFFCDANISGLLMWQGMKIYSFIRVGKNPYFQDVS
jgi:hypothetical protein